MECWKVKQYDSLNCGGMIVNNAGLIDKIMEKVISEMSLVRHFGYNGRLRLRLVLIRLFLFMIPLPIIPLPFSSSMTHYQRIPSPFDPHWTRRRGLRPPQRKPPVPSWAIHRPPSVLFFSTRFPPSMTKSPPGADSMCRPLAMSDNDLMRGLTVTNRLATGLALSCLHYTI